ncbi:hypothetical protein F2Q69_00033062 [Brassica cretica]|uniref:TF-B3 domain-containing protein n=1 Tax=Brassica cretica TaxID=69181 RepID=A0A8S9SI53_BRACR|nr:hypothetical protein F2Q69_00033062 [Brassica cretica]
MHHHQYIRLLHQIIPDAFFTTHLDGNNELTKLKLTSDACDTTWQVKLNGRRFADGWENFSNAHCLRNDDVLLFREDGEMIFHALAKSFTKANGLHKSWCEINVINQSGKSWVTTKGLVRILCVVAGEVSAVANKLKTGSFYRFELVLTRTRPTLKLCSKAKVSAKPNRAGQRSSMNRSRFMTVTLKAYMLKSRQLVSFQHLRFCCFI